MRYLLALGVLLSVACGVLVEPTESIIIPPDSVITPVPLIVGPPGPGVYDIEAYIRNDTAGLWALARDSSDLAITLHPADSAYREGVAVLYGRAMLLLEGESRYATSIWTHFQDSLVGRYYASTEAWMWFGRLYSGINPWIDNFLWEAEDGLLIGTMDTTRFDVRETLTLRRRDGG